MAYVILDAPLRSALLCRRSLAEGTRADSAATEIICPGNESGNAQLCHLEELREPATRNERVGGSNRSASVGSSLSDHARADRRKWPWTPARGRCYCA